ncbi:MAG: ATP-binding protein [Candidatus Omnitrophica bacterium]|nr:ATP-binding protein [Candidatus Omnitrophota bacterium]MBU4473441.1 ATP-binding protein [Candidatus Omnitrophota bacterium]MCG2706224.1 ATP-binding protein [Candidatus Omnitrophota bacterium]
MKQDNFFGREIYLELLERRIRDLKEGYRQNIAFIGDELVGKTSLIFKFLDKFYDHPTIILYLEVRPEPLDSFAKRFIGTLLYNFLIPSNIPLQEDLDFLINKSQGFIPKAIEKIKLILYALKKRKKHNIFTELLSLCEIINQETGKYCVVILDEFHNLESMGIKDLYREWSKLLILQKNTVYIITSSMQFKARTILSNNLSLLFGNFQTVIVEPFDIKASEGYMDRRLGELDINRGLKNFIVHFTGGYPFYLEVVTEAMLKSKQQDLTYILQDLLFEPAGVLNQRFSNCIKRFSDSPFSQDYISILYLVSGGHNKLKDLAHILRKQKKDLLSRVNRLLELDAVTRNGDFLRINDRVFSFWIKFVYQEKLRSLTFDAKNQKALFIENIEGMIDEFLAHAEKPIIERMMELLGLFQDDTIQIERKRLRLTHFKEIKALEFNNKSLKNGIIGRSNESLWIMGLQNDLLTEEYVADFTRECRKYRHKLQRKIIVAFQDIDANARLKALEEKVLTWDLNNLNQILDLYSKPRIII